MSKIDDIATAIGQKASEVSGIRTVDTKPARSVGRKLPAIFVAYGGFKQRGNTFGPNNAIIVYDFQMTLYLPLDGANLRTQWDSLVDLTTAILDTFRNSFTLDGVVMKAWIKSGRPVIDIPKNPDIQPKWLGHRFVMEVSFEEVAPSFGGGS